MCPTVSSSEDGAGAHDIRSVEMASQSQWRRPPKIHPWSLHFSHVIPGFKSEEKTARESVLGPVPWYNRPINPEMVLSQFDSPSEPACYGPG
jgi:hypothetical protein